MRQRKLPPHLCSCLCSRQSATCSAEPCDLRVCVGILPGRLAACRFAVDWFPGITLLYFFSSSLGYLDTFLFISCQRQDANVLPKRRQSHQGDKLCDVSTVPLVARWPVFLARGSDADGEPHYVWWWAQAPGVCLVILIRLMQRTRPMVRLNNKLALSSDKQGKDQGKSHESMELVLKSLSHKLDKFESTPGKLARLEERL